jgi:Spy/CpxP family protein refolding chaperone
MNFRKTGLCLVGMLLFLYPVVAMAEGDSPPGRWWRIPALAEKLDLSQQERQSLEGLFTQKRKVLFEMRSEVEKQRFELENILEAPALDQRAALEHFRRLEEKRHKLAAERFRYLLEVRRILGSERYLKLMTMARDYRGKRGPSQEDEFSPR